MNQQKMFDYSLQFKKNQTIYMVKVNAKSISAAIRMGEEAIKLSNNPHSTYSLVSAKRSAL